MIKRLWIDFETGGLDPAVNGLTQLAFLIEDTEGNVIEKGAYDIKPFEGSVVEPKALQVTGKTFDEVMSFEDEEAILEDFLGILRKHINVLSRDENFTIAGYNVQFDIKFLEAWMSRHHKKFFSYFNYHSVDPLAILRILRFEEETNLESLKLAVAYKAIFDEEFDAHDALEDIVATQRIYHWLLGTYVDLKRRKGV